MSLTHKRTFLEKVFICSLIALYINLILPISEIFPLPKSIKRVTRAEAFAEEPPNSAPILSQIGNRSVNEMEELQFTVTASDPDGDQLVYSASNLPEGATFDPNTQLFSWMPAYQQSGIYSNVHFEVADAVPNPGGGIDANTKLLLHGDGDNGSSSFIDSSFSPHIVSAYGNSHIDTSIKKWGTGSIYFDGAGDYLNLADSSDWDIGTDFTADLWVRHTDHSGEEMYINQFQNSDNFWQIKHFDGQGIKAQVFLNDSYSVNITAGEINDSNWHHIAFVKVGSDWGLYKDGVQIGYATSIATASLAAPLDICRHPTAGYYFDGSIDEIRISHDNHFGAAPNSAKTNTITVPVGEYGFTLTGNTDSEDITITVNNLNAPLTANITPAYTSVTQDTNFTLSISGSDADGGALTYELKENDIVISNEPITELTKSLSATGMYKYTLTVTNSFEETATDFSYVEVVEPGAGPDNVLPISGDFNGDGLTDIGTWDNRNDTWTIAFSEGGSFTNLKALTNIFGIDNYNRDYTFPVAGDFDGDGRTDIALYVRSRSNNKPEDDKKPAGSWIFASSDGEVFVRKASWDVSTFGGGNFSPLIGDFNSDGITDIGCSDSDPYLPSSNGRFWIKLGKDGETGFEDEAIKYETNLADSSTYSADFNGDGLPDILGVKRDTGDWQVLLSEDTSSSQLVDWVQEAGTTGETRYSESGGPFQTVSLEEHNKTKDGDFATPFSAGGTGFAEIETYTQFDFANLKAITQVVFKTFGETAGSGVRQSYNRVYLYYNNAWNEIYFEDNANTGNEYGSGITLTGDWPGVAGIKVSTYARGAGIGGNTSIARTYEVQTWGPSAEVESNEGLSAFSSGTGVFSPMAGFGSGKEPILTDCNHDGKTDIGYFDSTTHEWHYALSSGTGFSEVANAQWPTASDFAQGNNILPSGGDYNGDGIGDAAVFHKNLPGILNKWEIKLHNSKQPDLLISVNNGIGGTTNIEYEISTQLDNTGGDGIPDLPFPVPVVKNVTKTDGLGNSYTVGYEYQDGYFEPDSREFRGFGYVKIIDAEGTLKETWFNQDDINKGRPDLEKVSDVSGTVYNSVKYFWNSMTMYNGSVTFPYLEAQESQLYSGGLPAKLTRTEYGIPDSYGNVTEIRELGEYSGAQDNGDERYTYIQYAYNTADWILNKPKTTYITDSAGATVSQTRYYYDGLTNGAAPVKGSLTKEEKWLSGGTNPTTQFTYDIYGNVHTVTDARSKTTTTTYDALSQTFPVSVQNHIIGHTQQFTYDYNTGQILTSTDPNGQTTTTTYDGFGRIKEIRGPLDTSSPGITYTYDLSLLPAKITTVTKVDEGETATSYAFMDGLGRTIEVKTPAENPGQQIISGIVKFDSRGQVKEKYLPYLSTASPDYVTPSYTQPKIVYVYDPIGRVTQTTEPGGVVSTVQYDGWTVTAFDGNGHKIKSEKDAYGRLVKVTEYNGAAEYVTQYQYDALGNLKKTIDAQGNETTITYDTLGRKTSMNDPDMGVWRYTYNPVSSLKTQTDAKNQVLEFNYDSINRLTNKKVNGQIIVEYFYDKGWATDNNYRIGRLRRVDDSSGSTILFYDKLGREIRTRKIMSTTEYNVYRTYDSLDRLKTVTYPDGEVITYTYNKAGGVETVTGGQSYVTNVDYNVNGQMTRVDYGNGTYTTYAYDDLTLRLERLSTKNQGLTAIQDLTYTFDNVGNVLSITDASQPGTNTQTFGYDDLNRLTSATGESYGTKSYTYDSIGNMLQNGNITMQYGGTVRPHAVTSYTKNSLSYAVTYDANGNMTEKQIPEGTKTFTYDIENRLIEASVPKEELISNYTINLGPGWNFISLPIIPLSTDIAGILESSGIQKAQVSRYNSATQAWENFAYEAGKDLSQYSDFNTFEYGRGYEIYVDIASTLTVSGSTPLSEKTLGLDPGWNLISAPTTSSPIPISTALQGISYTRISYYNGTTYQDIDPLTGTLESGKGYFLLTSMTQTWNIPREEDITAFVYDGDGGRVKKITEDETVTYIGSSYEIQTVGVKTKIKKHIFMGSTRICTIENDGTTTSYYYFHQDHIGSSNVITDGDGQIAKLIEYAPYGLTSREPAEYNKYDTNCLYTGKLFDTDTGLYYYGARYYDPELGRFIQPDTIVPYPDDPQSFNRYAYARNNPIRYIDPSGHVFGIDDLIIGIIVGAVIGGITAAVTGGNIWMGVASGAIGGALFGAVGFTGVGGLAHTIGHATAGALSGSISSVMNGGDAFQGALIGAFSAGASEWMGSNVPFLRDTGGKNFGDYLGNVTRRALIGATGGGAVSFATGGDFWQGAAMGASTSAIAYTANDWMHKSGVIGGIKKFYRGVVDWFGTYYSKSYSYSFLMTGENYSPDGDIRDTITFFDLGGFSFDFSFGDQPMTYESTNEIGIGLGDYLSVGWGHWDETGGTFQKGALAVHVGLGIGTPIYYSHTGPSKTARSTLPDPTYLYNMR